MFHSAEGYARWPMPIRIGICAANILWFLAWSLLFCWLLQHVCQTVITYNSEGDPIHFEKGCVLESECNAARYSEFGELTSEDSASVTIQRLYLCSSDTCTSTPRKTYIYQYKQAFIDIRLRPGRARNWSPTLSAASPCWRRAHYGQTWRHP